MARKISILLALLLATASFITVTAEPVDSQFMQTWQRTDLPVSSGQASRTWMWGPEAFTGVLTEDYAESPGGERQVQYFDKSRMEITNPNAEDDGLWYVTNGLLSTELITGRMQLGDEIFEQRQPAEVNIAGDPDDPNGPTYASFAGLLDAPPIPAGWLATQRIDRDGTTRLDPGLAVHTVAVGLPDSQTNHTIADPFWAFMSSSGTVWQNNTYVEAPLFVNPYYATGRPITEPYWAEVLVGGTSRDVLMQCFERRCLTYTPDNPDGWQVEAGNVGQHYHAWRYDKQSPSIPQGVYISEVSGLEIAAGTIQDGVRTGATFIGNATEDLTGTFRASINYTPPNPGPGVENRIVGGTWSVTSPTGGVSGVFLSGTAVWDDDGMLAEIRVVMNVNGRSGIYADVPRLARFDGTLDHEGWPPNPPRISGVLTLYR